jgi:NADPH:quinone reductase-like Zn-dependent oxidoreductase
MKALIAKAINKQDPLSIIEFTTSFPRPNVSGNQVLVRTKAASVNPADVMYVDGTYEHAPAHPMPKFPCALGVDGAGIVEEIGAKVTKWKRGDCVLGAHHLMTGGTFGELCLFDESELVKKPEKMPWVVAASIPLVWLTAMNAFLCNDKLSAFHKAKQAGETFTAPISSMLVIGASGGIGSAALILAKDYFKIPRICAVCSTSNVEYAQQLGATNVIDYHKERFDAALASNPVDFVLDNVGGLQRLKLSLPIITPHGTYVTNVPGERHGGFFDILKFFAYLTWNNTFHSKKCKFNGTKVQGELLDQLVQWIDREKVQMSDYKDFLLKIKETPVCEGASALKTVFSGKSVGKNVLVFA